MITCKFENEKDAALRHAVVHVLAVKDNSILLVKRSPDLIEGKKWGFPGGFVDRDETLEQAALRELKEETGYEGTIKGFFRINSNPNRRNDAGRQNIAHEFLVELGWQKSTYDKEQTAIELRDIDSLTEEEMAFDHFETLAILKKYLKGEVAIPIV